MVNSVEQFLNFGLSKYSECKISLQKYFFLLKIKCTRNDDLSTVTVT
jgi:hypothetical protein